MTNKLYLVVFTLTLCFFSCNQPSATLDIELKPLCAFTDDGQVEKITEILQQRLDKSKIFKGSKATLNTDENIRLDCVIKGKTPDWRKDMQLLLSSTRFSMVATYELSDYELIEYASNLRTDPAMDGFSYNLPLTSPNAYHPSIIGTTGNDRKDWGDFMTMLEKTKGKPGDLWFAWSQEPIAQIEGVDHYALYMRKSPPKNRLEVTDEHLEEVKYAKSTYSNDYLINITMNEAGTKKWEKLTEQNVQRAILVTIDSKVYAAPIVNEPIRGGRSVITGNFTKEEADFMAQRLDMGRLPCKLEITKEGTK